MFTFQTLLMEYLRSVRFWVIVGVLATGAGIAYWLLERINLRRCGPGKYILKEPCPATGIDTLILTVYGRRDGNNLMEDTIQIEDGETLFKKQIKVPYVCNEILLSPTVVTPAEAEAFRKYLRCLGFVLKETCSCTDKLEKWWHPGPQHIYTIGVIKDPPPGSAAPSGDPLSLNYVIEIPPLENLVKADSTYFEKRNPEPGGVLGRNTVKIAVMDTGVDPAAAPKLLDGYLWKAGKVSPYQCSRQLAGTYGLNFYTPSLKMLEPLDEQGHGTHVTGIIIGVPGAKAGYQDGVPFQIITVKIIDDTSNSGTLFNAVCGLYYGLHQGAKVFNVSWGYLDTLRDKSYQIFEPFLKEARDSQAVVVAAMGNNSTYLNRKARFWPASFAENWENVISVGAVDANGRIADFSNWSTMPNMMSVVALGVEVVSLVPKKLQTCSWLKTPGSKICAGKCSGTSMAAPFVTRTVAVIKGKFPGIPAGLAKDRIVQWATQPFFGIYPLAAYRILNHNASILEFM